LKKGPSKVCHFVNFAKFVISIFSYFIMST